MHSRLPGGASLQDVVIVACLVRHVENGQKLL